MKVKTLNNSNLVTSTHFKVENTLLLVDVPGVIQKCRCLRCLMPHHSLLTVPFFMRSLILVPHSLPQIYTGMLAMQAK